MLGIDLSGKRAFVAGVADDGGFGFAIAKALASAGAEIAVGTWPPAYGIFTKMLERGKFDASLEMPGGGKLSFSAIVPFDADYDTYDEIPEDVRDSRRYKDHGDVSIEGAGKKLVEQFGDRPLDVVVHSLANGPEVTRPLLETSRAGYLGALGVSSYSFVSLVQRYGELVRPGGSFIALSYLAAERVVPGYGGGMSSAKAALEADARYLAYEAGRKWGHRVNVISAGPYASRAASAIGKIDKMIEYSCQIAPIGEPITADQVGAAAAFLCSPLAAAVTGTTLYVDNGYNIMGAGPENL